MNAEGILEWLTTNESVIEMPLYGIFTTISQSSGNPSLSRSGMGTRREHL